MINKRFAGFFLLITSLTLILCIDTAFAQVFLEVDKSGSGNGRIFSNDGIIDCGYFCLSSFNQNSQVTLNAVAAPGSAFSFWSGACSGTSSTCTVTLDSSKLAIANFNSMQIKPAGYSSPPPYPLLSSIISSGGNGGIDIITCSTCSWTATSSVPWITITSGGSGTGSGTVGYSVQANTGTVHRFGTISLGEQTFVITQPKPGVSDSTRPSISFTSPLNGNTIKNIIQLNVTATDTNGVSAVAYRVAIAGVWTNIGISTNGPKFNMPFDTRFVPDGATNLIASAYDPMGNTDFAPGGFITINMNNTASLADVGKTDWARDFDKVNGNVQIKGWDIKTDSQGNIFAIGDIQGTANYGSGTIAGPVSGGGAFLAKHNSSGSVLWAKSLSTGFGRGVAVDSQGNVIIAGYFSGNIDFDPANAGGEVVCSSANPGCAIFVAKYDSSGNYLWATKFGGTSSNNYGAKLAVDSSNNIYVTGIYYQGGTAGQFTLPFYGPSNVAIVKLSPAGNYLWATGIGGSSGDYGREIAVDSDNNVVVAGYTYSVMNFPGATYQGSTDMYVAKLSGNNGNLIWGTEMGSTGSDVLESLAINQLNDIIVVGSNGGPFNFGSQSVSSTGGLFAKYNSSGYPKWAKSSGQGTGPKDVALDSYGNIIITGGLTGGLFATEFNSQGEFIWGDNRAGTGWATSYATTVDNQNNAFTTGYFSGAVTFGTTQLTSASTVVPDMQIVKYLGMPLQEAQTPPSNNNYHQADPDSNFKISSTEISVYNSCWQTPGCLILGRAVSSLNVTNANSIWQASGQGCYQYNPSCSPSCWTSIATC